MSKEERVEAFFKMANNCVEKEGATTEDLEEILLRKIPKSRAGSCIPACLSETLGIVSSARTLQKTEENYLTISFRF